MVAPLAGPLGVITTLGDLLGFDGSDMRRVPVGTNGQVMVADAANPVGWLWKHLDPSELPPRDRFYVAGNNSWTDDGAYSAVAIGQNASINMSFEFPDDFGSIVSAFVVGIALATRVAVDIDIFSQYAGVGELKNANAQSDITSTYNLTKDTISALDISGLFTAAEAGDMAGIRVKHNAINTTIEYFGVILRYNGGP